MMSDLVIPTPYADQTTPEVVAARDSLTALLASGLPPSQHAACAWLHAYASEELARRLTDFVSHTEPVTLGLALEGLAYDIGVTRLPVAKRDGGKLSDGIVTGLPPSPLPPSRFGPVPVRGGGRRRG